jgi:lipoprotein NlpI
MRLSFTLGFIVLGTWASWAFGEETLIDPPWVTEKSLDLWHKSKPLTDLDRGLDQLSLNNITKARTFLVLAEAKEPTNADVSGLLAETYEIDGNFIVAQEYIDRGLRLDPDAKCAILQIAVSGVALQEGIAESDPAKRWSPFRLAASSSGKCIRSLRSNGDEHAPYAVFYAWLAEEELGDKEAAGEVLAGCLSNAVKNDPWDFESGITARFLLGRITEARYVQSIGQSLYGSLVDRCCESSFYIGARKYFSGDLAGAKAAFEQSVATGEKHVQEWSLASAYARRLGSRR